MMPDFEPFINFVRGLYPAHETIPLHAPCFAGNEKHYLNECIDSTYVSSVGAFVEQLEHEIADYVGADYAVAMVNGTSALHIALLVSGVIVEDEVITQPLTFVATGNAIHYCQAHPVFLDVDQKTLGLSADALTSFIEEKTVLKNGLCINKDTGRVVRACVPMHTFGHPCEIDRIKQICEQNNIRLIEDAAESLGSQYKGKYTGTWGDIGVFSFNGNKIITAGGGGCLVTHNKLLAKQAKHLSTTAKMPHAWAFSHDQTGWNYRMPNLNAALLLAQFEQLDKFIVNKRELALHYQQFFEQQTFAPQTMHFVQEPVGARSNYWLNALLLKDSEERDRFLHQTNKQGVMTRPVWTLLCDLSMFKMAYSMPLPNARSLSECLVNIPSSVRLL